MTTAADIARHLIRLAAEEPGGEPMTAMRLHKLLYYCQGWHLAWYGRPLFPERIEAWKHGPVVPDVWDQSRGHGRNPLPDPGGPDALPPDAQKSVDQVWRHFRQLSASGLREQTHREAPWRDHYRPDADGRSGETIPTAELEAYFGAEYRRRTGEEPGSEAAIEADIAGGNLIPHERLMKELGW